MPEGNSQPKTPPSQQRDEQELLASLDLSHLPRHIAVIMDGNGRWARERGLPRVAGHRAGAEAARSVIQASSDLGLEVLTLFSFSAENWKRPSIEVRSLMKLIEVNLRRELAELHRKEARVQAIGRLEDLPASLVRELERAKELTAGNQKLRLNLAINYGGRAEIVDATRRLGEKIARGELAPQEISEELFAQHLYDSEMPDPDLLIRTAGEFRVSNYLLWQMAYAEIWVTSVLWPDFRRAHFYQAIHDYQGRQRKFGGIAHAS